ncbi:TPA: baseplate J/gp47 family protein [Serratia marcescens]|uniref:baseplate J/gp47 family protein n=1 Tax=Serratia marcescens TaxID=615 RepID=UPI003703311A
MTMKQQVDYEKALTESGMPITTEQVNSKFNELVTAEGLITNTSKMSPFWRLIQAIITAPVMWLKDVLVSVVMANMYLATAGGTWLEMFAWGVNVKRKPATAAEGVFRFDKENASVMVTIPAGTVVQTERLNGHVYSVAVVKETTLAAGTAGGLVPVKATEPGGAHNLAPGYYRILPQAVPGIVRVENEEGWLLAPGADQESDDDLRDRARNQYNLAGNYHTDAVYRSMIASVAGLSIDRIFFQHDAPRGPGTANAYLLLDSGVASQPFINAVNDYITNKGNHGHGDDMQCFAMPETQHNLAVTLFVENKANFTADALAALTRNSETLIRCAFRQNAEYDVKKTWPYARFSFSNLARELHRAFPELESIAFSLGDIVSELNVPRLKTLKLEVADA